MKKIKNILEILENLKKVSELMRALSAKFFSCEEFKVFVNAELTTEQRAILLSAENSILDAYDLIEEKFKNIEIEF